jgi:hypothetical protein
MKMMINSRKAPRREIKIKPGRPYVNILRICFVSISFILLLTTSAWMDERYAPDIPEPGSVEAIARDTTEPRFMSSWVSYVPESKTVPSPSDFLGHIAGAKDELVSATQSFAYMRELDRTSDRVHVEVIGNTEEGREILLVAIADEEGIRNLEALKKATADLADPRRTSPEQAEKIIKTARPFYFVNCAIHADESVSPDMALELVYRLAVSETSMFQRIRKNIVVLVNPVANPDGRDKLVDWFKRFHKGKNISDYGLLSRQSPPYWGKYVYVDANRDAHQLALSTTRAVHKMFFDFHPTVIHDLHEAFALLQTWNGTGPYNPAMDPIVISEFLEMSFHEMSQMNGFNMPGVWTWNFGEGYGQPFTESIALNHNSIGRGYETMGNTIPGTYLRTTDPDSTTVEWYRPAPPPREFVWSHRNGVNYSQTGVLSILDYSARQAEPLLRNFYRKGYNSLQKGKAGNPFGFVIPANQGDNARVDHMINRLRIQHIEVQRADRDFQTKEGKFSAGDYVVKLDQPYRNYAVDLLLPQEFPENAEYQPYDDVSWALPVMYGLQTVRIDDRAILDVPSKMLAEDVHTGGKINGTGNSFVIADRGQEGLLAARYRLKDFKVSIVEKEFSSGNAKYPAGSWIIKDQSGLGDVLKNISSELGIDFDALDSIPEVAQHDAPAARLGVWVPWADTDSAGWIRYTLDQRKIPYTYIRDEEIKAGNLKNNVDVIIFGTALMALQEQIHGLQNISGPMPYKKTPETPSHGTPAESDDITGGIGFKGLANIQQFVQDGGVFITLGTGSQIPLEAGLVRNVERVNLQGVSTPGIELRAKFLQPEHPIRYGYPIETSAFRSNYGNYDPPKRWLTASYCTSCLDGPWDFRYMVMQWGTRKFESDEPAANPMILSGGGKKVEQIEGRPAILDVPSGKGRFLVYNFNPMHRDLNYSDYRFLWNGILNWQHIINKK